MSRESSGTFRQPLRPAGELKDPDVLEVGKLSDDTRSPREPEEEVGFPATR